MDLSYKYLRDNILLSLIIRKGIWGEYIYGNTKSRRRFKTD